MSKYVYKCECGHEQEQKHGITEDPGIKCKKCGNVMWRKPCIVGYNWKAGGETR